MDTKARMSKAFRMNGFQIKSDPRRHLEKLLNELDTEEEVEEWIGKIMANIQRRNMENAIIDMKTIVDVVKVNITIQHTSINTLCPPHPTPSFLSSFGFCVSFGVHTNHSSLAFPSFLPSFFASFVSLSISVS